MKSEKKADRYVSFEGIDCSLNARTVLQFAASILMNEEFQNKFWNLFLDKLKNAEVSETATDVILYLVCSNVYYLEELFEAANHKKGLDALNLCEYDCC